MIEPMKADEAKEIPSGKDHQFQRKIDGSRTIFVLDSCTRIFSDSGNDITQSFPELANLHKQARRPMIGDGEIAAKTFKLTQSRMKLKDSFKIAMAAKTTPVKLYVFDCLNLDHKDIYKEMQVARDEMRLENWVDSDVAFNLPYHEDGVKLFQEVMEAGGEGIMAKLKVASYTPGKRSSAWLKVKNFIEEADLYVIAVTRGEGWRENTFGSCLLARLVDGQYKYVGNAGSGLGSNELLHFDKVFSKELKQGEKVVDGKGIKYWLAKPVRVGDLGFEIRHTKTGVDGDDKLRFPTWRRKR